MAFTTDTWVLHKDWDKATITFEIINFAAAVAANKKGQAIWSKDCTIGGSQFGIKVYPSGKNDAAKNHVSIYTMNHSAHKVAYNHSITVGDVKKSGENNEHVEGKGGKGWTNFLEREEVGANLLVVVDITLLREEVGGAERGVVSRTFLKETVKEVLEDVNEEQEEKHKDLKNKMADNHEDLKNEIKNNKREQAVNHEDMKNEMKKMKTEQADKTGLEELKVEMKKMKQEMALARGPVKIPECVICLDELRPPLRIVQCIKGHKVCEPCSERDEEVKACPSCRAGFLGRDYGMEAFVRQLLGEQE